jgi:chromosome segregation ATPase
MNNEIRQYDYILSLRNKLKAIQQLSWELSQLDKRYPLEATEPSQYKDLIEAYEARMRQAKEVLDEYEEKNSKTK